MTNLSSDLTTAIWRELGGDAERAERVRFVGDGNLDSRFRVTDLASVSIACAGLAIADLIERASGARPSLVVDRRLASFWFGLSIRPIGWSLPAPWDPIAGDYRAADGWIRLHTNAPHHRAAAERVLGAHSDKAAVAAAVARWDASRLEDAIVESGGCAAVMHSIEQWREHDQGRALAREPLARIEAIERGPQRDWTGSSDRPLAGVRILDLTRVLAGPIASRFLAGYGAQVLRVDPLNWNEPSIVPEVTLGKRCARMDLTNAHDRMRFDALLERADVLLHGYRADALDRLGYDASVRAKLNPGLVDVALNAYGWTGPWRDRRGFDSLVQMSAGIAEAGMRWRNSDRPIPLPVQALDHATGYLLAAAVVRGIAHRLESQRGLRARLALARTAQLLVDHGEQPASVPFLAETAADRATAIEHTAWGDAQRLSVPLSIDGAPMRWDLPASELGSAAPVFH
jgi:crotonobetainyl-CoA:carnitine CoA-transferase CaiB-like acyl-CoA transferase